MHFSDPPVSTRSALLQGFNQSIEEFAASLQHLAVEVRQLSPGNFNGSTKVLALGDVELVRRTAAARYVSTGYFDNRAMFLFQRTGEIVVNGAHIDGSRQAAGVGSFDVFNVFPANTELLLVAIRLDRLSDYLLPSDHEMFLADMHLLRMSSCDPALKMNVSQTLFELFDLLQWLNHPLSQDQCKAYCRQIIALLRGFLAAQIGDGRLRSDTRERVLYRALKYLHHHPGCSLDELANASYASKRSLQYFFADLLQEKPMHFAKRLRINLVYWALIEGKQTASQRQLAFQHGFTNQSRMSREYKAMFGETPADTLARIAAARGNGGSLAETAQQRRPMRLTSIQNLYRP